MSIAEPQYRGGTRRSARVRRREVESRLAGLKKAKRGWRSEPPAGIPGADGQLQGVRLREALEELGPVFSLFGLYLATRVDLFPVAVCDELSSIADSAEPTPYEEVLLLLGRELGRAPERAFAGFEAEPFESGLMFQTHRALLAGGGEVAVKVRRPEFDEQAACDLELLPLLEDALAAWPRLPFGRVLADFRHALGRQADLSEEAAALLSLVQESSDFPPLAAPALHLSLCTTRVLTRGATGGVGLQEILDAPERPRGWGAGDGALAWPDRAEAARRLWFVWLRQALAGRSYPSAFAASNVRVLADGRVAFDGGQFTHLPEESRANVRDYLVALAAEDPDRACTLLLRETAGAAPRRAEDALRQGFRQVVPLRDGGWREDGQQSVVQAFVQWRLAGESGYGPPQHLLDFYRGFYQVARAARELAPGQNTFLDGLRQARVLDAAGQLRDLVTLRQLEENFDRYAAAFLDLPRRLDEALTLAAEGDTRLDLRVAERPGRRRSRNSSAVFVALLLVLAAVALLTQHLATATQAGVWAERAGAVLFVGVGAMLLRAASRA